MAELYLNTAQLKEKAKDLRVNDRVFLSGDVYTSRDAAHKRICEMINNEETLPFELAGACIYYAGPTPARPGTVIGSCGPTTSGRMDPYTPALLGKGLCAMVGKGERNDDVCKSIVENESVYFCAIGGAGALAAKCITECEEIAFKDLGCESIKRLVLKNFPVIVAIDCKGNNVFKVNNKQ
ncbi:MAG TPA: FumA C-terminus/TtdB family hydratase beta subunit [Clostridia bacterium]|nr:FumA C-terminus/TtdB family hydratase beta subunit [Clostridia bacterium]